MFLTLIFLTLVYKIRTGMLPRSFSETGIILIPKPGKYTPPLPPTLSSPKGKEKKRKEGRKEKKQ